MEFWFLAAVASGLLSWVHLISTDIIDFIAQILSRFMGSRSHPRFVLCVCMCVCVSRCLWVCVIEADSLQLRVITVGYIRSCHAVSLCQILAVFAVFGSAISVRSCSWFRDSRALLPSWTPNAGDSSAHCFPALPASAYGESSSVVSRYCLFLK